VGAIRRFLGLERRSATAPATTGGPIGADGWPVGQRWDGNPESIAAVLAAVNLISGSIATLPLIVRRSLDGQMQEAPAHPLARLHRDGANEHQSWPEWCEWQVAECLLRGMAASEAVWDGRGAVRELRPMPRTEWAPMRAAGGGLVFEHATTRRRVLARDTVLLRDRADDGVMPRSRAERAADVLRGALALQGRANTLWERAAAPAGVLQSPKMLDADVAARLREQWQGAYGGPTAAGKTAVLEDGVEWKPVQFSPVDAQMLESRKFAVIEIARVFGVPPQLLQDLSYSSYQNSD
jgi:HK97 family phage portal protein